MIKIKVRTRFDITATGVTGHFKSARLPFTDKSGKKIDSLDSWNRARNQQRNWESLTQLISLRTQIFNLTDPEIIDSFWQFEFQTETEIFNDSSDPVGILKADAAGIPMLQELDNDPDIEPVLITSGPKQNIWFSAETINIE